MNVTFESWKRIPDFPDYMISNKGNVYNHARTIWMTLSANEDGTLTVGLTRDGHQYRRSVKVLVARAFVDGEDAMFDTPILLDGDQNNVNADNIQWRPRWFAWRYTRQFEFPPTWAYSGPVFDSAGNIYESIIEAASLTGSLITDVRFSIADSRVVFPHGLTFKYK